MVGSHVHDKLLFNNISNFTSFTCKSLKLHLKHVLQNQFCYSKFVKLLSDNRLIHRLINCLRFVNSSLYNLFAFLASLINFVASQYTVFHNFHFHLLLLTNIFIFPLAGVVAAFIGSHP